MAEEVEQLADDALQQHGDTTVLSDNGEPTLEQDLEQQIEQEENRPPTEKDTESDRTDQTDQESIGDPIDDPYTSYCNGKQKMSSYLALAIKHCKAKKKMQLKK